MKMSDKTRDETVDGTPEVCGEQTGVEEALVRLDGALATFRSELKNTASILREKVVDMQMASENLCAGFVYDSKPPTITVSRRRPYEW
jgi:hypothetical protein